MNVPPLITYPARPIQGGRLELAPPKRGLWYAEPKLNGWRALIHTPTGTMWNRHGALLTIADCFRPALAALAKLAPRGLVWADCEALERRHNLGRGTLVVLDAVPESGTQTYVERRSRLESLLPCDAVFGGDTTRLVPCNAVLLPPTQRHVAVLDGLITALGAAANDLVVVLACDLPFVTSELIGALVGAVAIGSGVAGEGGPDVALAEANGRVEPLVGCWRTSRCQAVLEQAFASGQRAVHRALAGLSTTTAAASPETVVNVNRADDLER